MDTTTTASSPAHARIVSVWATFSSVGLFMTGLFTALSFHPTCILVGFYVVFLGFVTAVIEAPLIYRVSDFSQKLHMRFSDVKTWQKGAFYIIAALPVFLCIGFLSTISVLLLISNAVGYFILTVGSTASPPLSVRADASIDDPLLAVA
eukprot:CFRG5413T1